MNCKTIFLSLYLLLFTSSLFANYNKSVVRINSTLLEYNYNKPWESAKEINAVGSGVVIENQYILTSAHVVSNAKLIRVKKDNDLKEFYAKVKYIYHQADLALLEVYDKSFFKNAKALKLNRYIKPNEKVNILGYPKARRELVIENAVVSKTKYNYYFQSNEDLLVLQIKASIYSGNSGGPVLDKNDNIVGIIMQKPKNGKDITYATPSFIIYTFLEDIKDGKVDALHSNSNAYQFINNKSLQNYYSLNEKAVLVTDIDVNEKQLRVDDVILKIENHKVSSITADKFYSFFHSKQVGETIDLSLFRDSKVINIDYELNYSKKLINHEFDMQGRYYIFGGLVFAPVTRNYLQAIGLKQYEIDMLFYQQKRTSELEEPVIWIEEKFLHEINKGYISKGELVDKVNNIKVKSFNHFIKLIEDSKEKYIVIDFVKKQRVVLDKNKAINSFEEIKKKYRVLKDRKL